MNSNQITYDNKKKENISICECCGVCLIFILGIGVIAGAIAYTVFGIMYLVQDYDISHSCDGSALWAYVLTAIILAFSRSGAKNASSDSEDAGTTICTLVCLGLLEAGLAIWGGTELWIKSCDDLAESNLWKFGLATFILQTFCASIFLVIIPLGIGCSLVMESRNSSDNNEENSMV
jgi:hypothetical protein